jgi:hypothetical protein
MSTHKVPRRRLSSRHAAAERAQSQERATAMYLADQATIRTLTRRLQHLHEDRPMRTVLGLFIGAAIAAAGLACTTSPLSTTTSPSQVGRFQIVNGTPQFAVNIMLLDTTTGESWQACGGEGKKEITQWCKMERH